MAYTRDWDRGKGTWDDASTWGDVGGRSGNVRSRDEDFQGDGKRRKYNNGGHDPSHAYDEDPANAQGQEDRPQRGFTKKRLMPSEPSPHVIFLGLDPDFTEADLQAYLASNGCTIETVTIIRERSTGVSKGFGFAQFATVDHARAFVDPLFPFIQIPPPASHGATATAAFYKALETGLPHTGRRVKIDYSQSATPHEKGRLNRQSTNDGTRDIGNSQAPVLLFRGLDPLSGPQAIAQAMYSSSGPGKKGAMGMKRIILIKDKVTLASFGFAFVEFVDIQSAAAVLGVTMSPQIHPSGFRISDRPVASSFAHPYSFQPSADLMIRDEACLPSSVALGGAEGTWVRYWDEGSTVAVLEFEVEEPLAPQQPVKDKKEKRKGKGAEPDILVAALPVPAEASVLPVSDKPVTLNLSKGVGAKPVMKAPGPVPLKMVSLGFSSIEEPAPSSSAGEGADRGASAEGGKHFSAKKVAPLIASKKTVNNINKWNQVQGELNNETESTTSTSVKAIVPPPAAKPVELAVKAVASVAAVENEFEFSDVNALTCLLCARQFKTVEQLKRHNKESELHKKNYKDTNLREVARQKASNARRGGEEQPKYRDRASERRIMHNQPEAPVVSEKEGGGGGGKKKHMDVVARAPTPPAAPVNPGEDESNMGNKLLKMMGWKEGTGLGAGGEGRVEPIQTAIYAQGAGLGASKGKEIGKYGEGYSGYVHMAQDGARERFGG